MYLADRITVQNILIIIVPLPGGPTVLRNRTRALGRTLLPLALTRPPLPVAVPLRGHGNLGFGTKCS